jgi:hypothetical protein
MGWKTTEGLILIMRKIKVGYLWEVDLTHSLILAIEDTRMRLEVEAMRAEITLIEAPIQTQVKQENAEEMDKQVVEVLH